jgi:hypothetical protein
LQAGYQWPFLSSDFSLPSFDLVAGIELPATITYPSWSIFSAQNTSLAAEFARTGGAKYKSPSSDASAAGGAGRTS